MWAPWLEDYTINAEVKEEHQIVQLNDWANEYKVSDFKAMMIQKVIARMLKVKNGVGE